MVKDSEEFKRGPTAPILLSCYVERRGDWWEAACPHLDFAARGDSLLKAQESLGRMIHKYVEYVETQPRKNRVTSYNRRAPFYVRLGRAILRLVAGKPSRRRNGRRHHRARYTVSCHATP
jgi:hypothetical protein